MSVYRRRYPPCPKNVRSFRLWRLRKWWNLPRPSRTSAGKGAVSGARGWSRTSGCSTTNRRTWCTASFAGSGAEPCQKYAPPSRREAQIFVWKSSIITTSVKRTDCVSPEKLIVKVKKIYWIILSCNSKAAGLSIFNTVREILFLSKNSIGVIDCVCCLRSRTNI